MRHLDVEDRVLVGLLLGQVHVEGEGGVAPAHEEEVAGGVGAHLVAQLPQGDEGPRPLGHLHLFPALHYLDQLDQRHFEGVLGIA